MSLIRRFDPWLSPLCTCPPKLALNPYTGCDHACVYCYASSYVPRFSACRPKKDLIAKLRREASKLRNETVSISNSSDPYPNLEAETSLTRSCLEILSRSNCRIQIITKSHLVLRDIDILRRIPSMVSLTISTDDDLIAALIEPHATLPSERLRTARALVREGIPTSVRIDPIIPLVNDEPETLAKKLASIGVRHITGSTYKVKSDNWKRLSLALPKIIDRIRPLYFEKGERINGYAYLPKDLRITLMKRIRVLADELKMGFGTCREGLSHLNSATCDGSWLMGKHAATSHQPFLSQNS